MELKISDDLTVVITRMDKYYDTGMNQINLNLTVEDIAIDSIANLVKENKNSFDFVLDKEEMSGYKLLSASESFDALSNAKTASLVFIKSC